MIKRHVGERLDVVDVGGLAPKPSLAGNGGRGRGMPRQPSSDAISAVSSPQTKAPAPSVSSMSKSNRCRGFLPRRPAAGLRHGDREALDGHRVLGADVDESVGAPIA